ncbi:hypothetical protein HY637_02100, partial [Candidatus Woesearchaeota archaeon]|nr:hypothetical protein [Candidatus Woesearchaeota archaeon]
MNQEHYNGFYQELIPLLKSSKFSGGELAKLKIKLCRKYNLQKIPTDTELFL